MRQFTVPDDQVSTPDGNGKSACAASRAQVSCAHKNADGRDAPGLESRNDTVTSHPSSLNLIGWLQIKHSSVPGNGGIFSKRPG